MPVWAWILIAVVLAVVVLAAIVAYLNNRRTARLQQRFGHEYQHTVSERGDQRTAEKDLAERERQREKIDVVPLSEDARTKYLGSWRSVQTRFVDDPVRALGDADSLITDVMRERGYPIDDFEQRAADVSVDHPEVVQHYRAAHAVYLGQEQVDGAGDTEDLRQAFVHYRALFEELVETSDRGIEEANK
jgi:predicted nucleic acid-binding protein